MKKKTTAKKDAPVWNLGLLYKSPEDPQIEKDMKAIEKMCEDFARKYETADKRYLADEQTLARAMKEYESMLPHLEFKPNIYFYYFKDLDASNTKAASALQLLSSRAMKAVNIINFFELSIGKIPKEKQDEFLKSPTLAPYKVFLWRIFQAAQHDLSLAEEKIINLKSQPAYQMWVDGNDRVLSKLSVKWKGKDLPMYEASQRISATANHRERYKLHDLMLDKLKGMSDFSESEINAIYTDKKIEDELRGYKTPFANTVRGYRNDPKVVERLVDVVTKSFPISHRYFKLKAKILKLKKLRYADRAVKTEKIKTKFSFEESHTILRKIFGSLDKKYADYLDSYVKNGQIDVLPRVGKTGGAYCSSSYLNPTFVLLNHVNEFDSFTTFAHEMGHAFHGELSQHLSPLYVNYSYSLAETASTLFETIAAEAVFETLSDKEKIIVLENNINSDVATVFRQIACFNFELDLHNAVRTKGYVSKEEIADLHNKNMKAYLGPVFDLRQDDGFFFVQWGHIRRFFYVYSYAYGQLVTKALLRRYKKDKSFWASIEKFLSAGGKASPEEILLEIGIDVSKPEFWMEGLKEIEEDIARLEKLVGRKEKHDRA